MAAALVFGGSEQDCGFTNEGVAVIERIFALLDRDRSGGLSFSELRVFFAQTEPDFALTREMFDTLEVDVLADKPEEISPVGFQTFYMSLLESDFEDGKRRLERDWAMFSSKEEEEVVVEVVEAAPPQQKKRDAFAEMLRAAATAKPAAAAAHGAMAVESALSSKRGRKKASPPPPPPPVEAPSAQLMMKKAITAVDNDDDDAVDLTSSRESLAVVASSTNKTCHPFFQLNKPPTSQPSSTLPPVAPLHPPQPQPRLAVDSCELVDFPYIAPAAAASAPPPAAGLHLHPAPFGTLRQRHSSSSSSPVFISLLDEPYQSVLGRNLWEDHHQPPPPSLPSPSRSAVAVVESELWTHASDALAYSDSDSSLLLLPQAGRVEHFLTSWLQQRQQQQQQRPTSSSSSDSEEESDAWGTSDDEAVDDGDDSRPPPAPESHVLLMYGPVGCGKTLAVHAIARQLGFRVVEVNAGDDLLQLEKLHGEATQSYGLQGSKKRSKLAVPLVLIDEFDVEFDGGEHEEQTAAVKRFVLRSKCPVILVPKADALPKAWSTDGTQVDRVRNFHVECVKCDMPSADRVASVLQRVVAASGTSRDVAYYRRLALRNGCDVRRCLNQLQFGGVKEEEEVCEVVVDQDDNLPDLDALCPLPEIASVNTVDGDGEEIEVTGRHLHAVLLDGKPCCQVNGGGGGDTSIRLQREHAGQEVAVTASFEEEEEDELWEDPPPRTKQPLTLHELQACARYRVGQVTIERSSNAMLVSSWLAPRTCEDEQQPQQPSIASSSPALVDVHAARTNLATLRKAAAQLDCELARMPRHRQDDEDDDNGEEEVEENARSRRYRDWFRFFLRDRASLTHDVPFVMAMCQLDVLNKLAYDNNNSSSNKGNKDSDDDDVEDQVGRRSMTARQRAAARGGGQRRARRAPFLKHFAYDLDWVDAASTARAFSLCFPPKTTTTQQQHGSRRSRLVLSEDDDDEA